MGLLAGDNWMVSTTLYLLYVVGGGETGTWRSGNRHPAQRQEPSSKSVHHHSRLIYYISPPKRTASGRSPQKIMSTVWRTLKYIRRIGLKEYGKQMNVPTRCVLVAGLLLFTDGLVAR